MVSGRTQPQMRQQEKNKIQTRENKIKVHSYAKEQNGSGQCT